MYLLPPFQQCPKCGKYELGEEGDLFINQIKSLFSFSGAHNYWEICRTVDMRSITKFLRESPAIVRLKDGPGFMPTFTNKRDTQSRHVTESQMGIPISLDDMMLILLLLVVLFFAAREVRRGIRHGVMYEIHGRGDDYTHGGRLCYKEKEPWCFRFLMLFYVSACIAIVVIVVYVVIDRTGIM